MGSNRQPVELTPSEINLDNADDRNKLNALLKKYVDYAVTVELGDLQKPRSQAIRQPDGSRKHVPENKYIFFFENRNTASDFCKKILKEFKIGSKNDARYPKVSRLIGKRHGVYMRVSECNSIYAELRKRELEQSKPAEMEMPVALITDFVEPAAGKRSSVTNFSVFAPKIEPQDFEKEKQFRQFKEAYEQKYQASASKKHKKMMTKLESNEIKNIDQVIDYARQKPYSLTASVLASFDFVDEFTQLIIAYGQDQKKPWATKDSGLEALLKNPESSMDDVRQYAEASPKSKASVILAKMEERQLNKIKFT
jgi:hypothetical protein